MLANGHAWTGAVYNDWNGRRAKENVKAVSCLALDFDQSATSPLDVVEYAQSIGLPPTLAYWSYSQDEALIPPREGENWSPHIKNILCKVTKTTHVKTKAGFNFRVVWVLDKVVEPAFAEEYTKALMEAFKQFGPDPSCKDSCRIWFGGRIGTYVFEETPISPVAFAACEALTRYGKVRNDKLLTKASVKPIAEVPMPDAVGVDKNWSDFLRTHCRLWDLFVRGYYLNYNQRLALFSNLKFLRPDSHKDGKTLIGDIWARVCPATYEGHTFTRAQLADMMSNRTLRPMEICFANHRWMTAPELFRIKDGLPVHPTKPEGIVPLEELDAALDTLIPAALSSTRNVYFNAQTACGKTERIFNWMRDNVDCPWDPTDKVLYVVPTHNLALEAIARLSAKMDPRLITYICETEYSEEDLKRLQTGLPALYRDPTRSAAICKLYSPEERGVFIATHSFLTNVSDVPTVDLIIVDENIELGLVHSVKINAPQLRHLAHYLPDDKRAELEAIVDTVLDAEPYTRIPPLTGFLQSFSKKKCEEWLKQTRKEDLVPQLFRLHEAQSLVTSTEHGVPVLRALFKSHLIDQAAIAGIPIKLFTATPMPQRIKNYYGVDFESPDIPISPNAGKVVAYRGMTGARGKRTATLGMDEGRFKDLVAYVRTKLTPE